MDDPKEQAKTLERIAGELQKLCFDSSPTGLALEQRNAYKTALDRTTEMNQRLGNDLSTTAAVLRAILEEVRQHRLELVALRRELETAAKTGSTDTTTILLELHQEFDDLGSLILRRMGPTRKPARKTVRARRATKPKHKS